MLLRARIVRALTQRFVRTRSWSLVALRLLLLHATVRRVNAPTADLVMCARTPFHQTEDSAVLRTENHREVLPEVHSQAGREA